MFGDCFVVMLVEQWSIRPAIVSEAINDVDLNPCNDCLQLCVFLSKVCLLLAWHAWKQAWKQAWKPKQPMFAELHWSANNGNFVCTASR